MEQLPEPLRVLANYKQWILWTTEVRNDKLIKLPIDYRTCGRASVDDPNSWTDATTVINAAKLFGGNYGVGFVFTKDDPFFFVDIDKCRVDESSPWSETATAVLSYFPGAAVEVSQSGRGLHIFGMGNAPDHSCKNIPLGLEFYTEGRFVALTGDDIIGDAGTTHNEWLPNFVTNYVPPKIALQPEQWTTGPVPEWNGPEDDDELIHKALTSSSAAGVFGTRATFRDLWECNPEVLAAMWQPDASDGGGYDESAADMALMQHLAFWTGKNCERIIRLMWHSKLVRDKWTAHKSYLRNSIMRSVSLQKNVYGQSIHENKLIIENFTDIESAASLSNDNTYKSFEKLHVKSSVGFTGDHYFDAIIIISSVFDNRLVNLNGDLHYFNGRECQNIKDQTVRRYIARAMGGGDVKITQSRINGTLSVIKDQAPELGDSNPVSKSVYFINGVLRPETGKFSDHNINNRNTSTLSVEYRPDNECPKFIEFLISTVGVDSVQLVQEIIGFILCRDNLGIEKSVLFIGPPRAGKGVIARLIFSFLGSGAVPFNLSELDDNKRLSGMRNANVAIDTDAGSASNRNAKAVMALFKIISSNEKLSILQLYTQTPWEGALNCKMLVLANSIPSMFDDSAATANRWIPVVFNKSFLGNENPNLFKQLSKELPGIASWAVIGLRRLIERGHFELPQNSLDQLDSLISDGGSIQEFINECLIVDESQRASDSDLWEAYRRWAMANGREINKRRHMLKSLEDSLRGNGGRRAKSVKLKDGKGHRGFYGVGINIESVVRNVMPFSVPAN